MESPIWPSWRRSTHGLHKLVAQGVDIGQLITITDGERATTALASCESVTLRPKEAAALEAAGISTVGDLATLCRKTASYSSSGLTQLPTHIDLFSRCIGARGGVPQTRFLRLERATSRCRSRRRHGECPRRLLPVGMSRDRSLGGRTRSFRVPGVRDMGEVDAGSRGSELARVLALADGGSRIRPPRQAGRFTPTASALRPRTLSSAISPGRARSKTRSNPSSSPTIGST